MMIVIGGYKTRRKELKDADHDITVRETTYTAGQTQIWGGKAQSGFISCGISDFGGRLLSTYTAHVTYKKSVHSESSRGNLSF